LVDISFAGRGWDMSDRRQRVGGLSWPATFVFVFYMFVMRDFLAGHIESIWLQLVVFFAITAALILGLRGVLTLLKR
jgi:hypothetical protein